MGRRGRARGGRAARAAARDAARPRSVEPRPDAAVADLGTGSGAIALALEAELPDVEVWATDVSEDALAVARANVAGCAATRVRIGAAGSWFDALPGRRCAARCALIVSNPPYIADARGRRRCPTRSPTTSRTTRSCPGPTGIEALELVLDAGARMWLAPGASARLRARAAPGRRGGIALADELGFRESRRARTISPAGPGSSSRRTR